MIFFFTLHANCHNSVALGSTTGFTFLSIGHDSYAYWTREEKVSENMKQSREKWVYAQADVKIGYLNR